LLALCLLLGLQEEVIQRSDPARSQYQEAVELCKAAEELLERDPEAAATKLTELLDRFGQLPKIERRLRIKVFADDAGAPHAFFPYQLRGRARLAAAKDPDRIEAAVRDFERSVERGAASSKPLLQSARAAWWASLRPQLARDGAGAGASDKARGLLRDLAQDGGETTLKDALSWYSDELRVVEERIVKLRRGEAADRRQAAQDGAWCRSSERVLENLAAAKDLLARIRVATVAAGEIAGFRGSFRLKISAAPWAEVRRFAREGKEIPLPVRETPLMVAAELELGDYEIELAHPKLGSRTKRLAAKELEEGKTYLLSADLEAGTITLRLAP
jgi:hypothetical protein